METVKSAMAKAKTAATANGSADEQAAATAAKKGGGATSATTNPPAPNSSSSKSPKKVRIATPPQPTPAGRPASGGHRRGSAGHRRAAVDSSASRPFPDDAPARSASAADAAVEDENQRLRAALTQMKDKWRGVKRAISGGGGGESSVDREALREVVRETHSLRADLRDILREELAAFSHTLHPSTTAPAFIVADAAEAEAEAGADAQPEPKRRRVDEEQPAAAPLVVEAEATAATDDAEAKAKAVAEAEEKVRAAEEQLERERQRARLVEDEMKKVKRKTKIVYERYGVLKKRKGETEEQLKKAEREAGDLRKANATFVERNETLATQLREAAERATQAGLAADKARAKAQALKRQTQELALFRDRQTERVAGLEAERDEARVALEALDARLRECGEERDRLAERDVGVDDQEWCGVQPVAGGRIRLQVAVGERLEIERQHADAMAVMAAEIGQHQMIGGLGRFRLAPAGGADHGADEGAQGVWGMRSISGHGLRRRLVAGPSECMPASGRQCCEGRGGLHTGPPRRFAHQSLC